MPQHTQADASPTGATRFRKKPVEIQATHWDGTQEGATAVIDWVLAGGGAARWHEARPEYGPDEEGKAAPAEAAWIAIDTLEGTMRAAAGDWIIRGVKGEHYPCKPDIFEATYNRVGQPSGPQLPRGFSVEKTETGTLRVRLGDHDLSDLLIQEGGPIVVEATADAPWRTVWVPFLSKGAVTDPDNLLRHAASDTEAAALISGDAPARSTSTDCRTSEGVTVGLIDGVIAICRVVAHQDLTDHSVVEALTDLRADEDVAEVLGR